MLFSIKLPKMGDRNEEFIEACSNVPDGTTLLDLRENSLGLSKIDTKTIEAAYQILPQTITTFDFSRNSLFVTTAGKSTSQAYLQRIPLNVHTLILDDHGNGTLLEALNVVPKHITSLVIHLGSIMLKSFLDEKRNAIFNAFPKTLESLDFSNSILFYPRSSKELHSLFKLLPPNLRALSLSGCFRGATSDKLKAIFTALPECLQFLDLSGFFVSNFDDIQKYILSLTHLPPNVTEIALGENDLLFIAKQINPVALAKLLPNIVKITIKENISNPEALSVLDTINQHIGYSVKKIYPVLETINKERPRALNFLIMDYLMGADSHRKLEKTVFINEQTLPNTSFIMSILKYFPFEKKDVGLIIIGLFSLIFNKSQNNLAQSGAIVASLLGAGRVVHSLFGNKNRNENNTEEKHPESLFLSKS